MQKKKETAVMGYIGVIGYEGVDMGISPKKGYHFAGRYYIRV